MQIRLPVIALICALGALQASSAGAQAVADVASAPAERASEPPLNAGPSVPRLRIIWTCADCPTNDKVVPLIENAYAIEAGKSALPLSNTDVADVEITDFRQRPPAVRAMFGIMAGKDRLALRIRYQDNEFAVSDYSANALQGMNHLCESVGKQTFAKLKSARAQ